jgi:hypothetical protein
VKVKIVALLVLCSTAVIGATGLSSSVSGFLLGGAAKHALDPENPSNEVIKIDNTIPPGQCVAPNFENCTFGTISRSLNTRIQQLDNMLEFKSYFQNRSCGGGSPRIQLSIDLDGDGNADKNAFGHTRPPFSACVPNRWQYDDVTDELPRWDVSQLVALGFPSPTTICTLPVFATNPIVCPTGGFQTHSGYIPWVVFETVLSTLFPYHRVCAGSLVDDSGWYAPATGVAYYDVISLGRRTWVDFSDTAGRGSARGCSAATHCEDDRHFGDKDHDHDFDDDDDRWDADRSDRWGD